MYPPLNQDVENFLNSSDFLVPSGVTSFSPHPPDSLPGPVGFSRASRRWTHTVRAQGRSSDRCHHIPVGGALELLTDASVRRGHRTPRTWRRENEKLFLRSLTQEVVKPGCGPRGQDLKPVGTCASWTQRLTCTPRAGHPSGALATSEIRVTFAVRFTI